MKYISLILSIISFLIIIFFSLYYFIVGGPIYVAGPTGPYNIDFIGPTGPKGDDILGDINKITQTGPMGPMGPTGLSFISSNNNLSNTIGFIDGTIYYGTVVSNRTLIEPFNKIYKISSDTDEIKLEKNNQTIKTGQIVLFDLTNANNDVNINSNDFKSMKKINSDGSYGTLNETLKKGKVYLYEYLGNVSNTSTSNNTITNDVIIKSRYINE